MSDIYTTPSGRDGVLDGKHTVFNGARRLGWITPPFEEGGRWEAEQYPTNKRVLLLNEQECIDWLDRHPEQVRI